MKQLIVFIECVHYDIPRISRFNAVWWGKWLDACI